MVESYTKLKINPNEVISFALLKEDDIDLLIQWLNLPHVLEYWPLRLTDAEIRVKYIKHIHSGWVFPYLIRVANRPIGYIQCYQTWMEGNDRS